MKKIIKTSVFFLCLNTAAFSQATISGRVFNDLSGNAAYNAGEELSNVTIWLFDLNAVAPYYRVSPINTATTDASGIYSFTNLAAGNYQVRVKQSTVPVSITRAVFDNDSYPNGVTQVMGVSGTNTYANINFGFAATSATPSFTSLRNFQWNAVNSFVNTMSAAYNLTPEVLNGNTIYPTITWSTDRTNAPGGGYGTDTYPQASYPSAILGQGFPGNNKGGIHPADNTFQLIYGDANYTTTNNDRQTTTIQFNVPVINSKFSIYDIDHADPQVSTGRIDHVKVVGYFNNVPVMPVILNPSAEPWNTVSGNTVYGFADYSLTNYTTPFNSQNEDHATVNVYFSGTINRIVIEYEEWAPVMLPGKGINDATAPNLATNEASWSDRTNPTNRGISIGSIDYTFDAASYGLPLRLKDFNATAKNCSVSLNWETLYEESLDYFDIEYSQNGMNFKSAGRQAPENNITGAVYHFSVPQNFATGYYRLKSVDIGGKFQYSPVRYINTNCNNEISWSIFTNPVLAGNEITIRSFVTAASDYQATIQIWNMLGQKILQQPALLHAGQNSLSIKTSTLKPGTYMVGMIDRANKKTGDIQKLVIQ